MWQNIFGVMNDGNKRTALALYLMSVEEKTLGEILEQYSPLFEALSKV